MKLMATALVSLFAVAAMANQPATTAKTTETKTATTTTTAAPAPGATAMTAPADAGHADAKKACEGKAGAELKKCEADAKKAAHTK